MKPSRQLIDDIDLRKLQNACRMTPTQRFAAGPELFDLSRSFMLAGIRMQNPDADEVEVLRIARERLELASKLEENDFIFNRYLEELSELAAENRSGTTSGGEAE